MKTMNHYVETFQEFTKMFGNLSKILDKFQTYAETKKFEPSQVLTARLAPDQFNLIRQVQIMSDSAKFGLSRLTGKEGPAFEDKEQTIDELRGRISKTIAYLKTATATDFEGSDERKITLPRHDGKFLYGKDYLHEYVIPNVYFHFTTAYAIFRHNGLDIGKKDFLGELAFVKV